VIVSAGGGRVGDEIYAAALQAAAGQEARWRLLVGGNDSAARRAALAEKAPANVRIEALRPDFRAMLHHASASVSLCGYNTALDVLQSGVPAVFIPFDAGGEVEQTIRAETLGGLPGIETIRTSALDGDALRQALARVTRSGARDAGGIGLGGAAETVRLALDLSA
jgi:predicted glycosyltransferase